MARWPLFLLLLIALLPAARAQEDRKCHCIEGNASYLYLRCPKAPPADPDPCPSVINGVHPPRALPKAWNDMCWQSPRMECFLRRHAASWNITCSMCLTGKRCCPFPNWRNCPECHAGAEPRAQPLRDQVLRVLAEQRRIGGKRVQLAVSPHYVIVTDILSLKIATARGAPRIARQHELVHLYLQRAEQARADWTRVFGAPDPMRSMMVLTWSESTRQRFAQAHFGNAKTNLLYGGSKGTRMGGLAGNGFCLSGRDDDTLHFNCRHMIGHLCISTCVRVATHAKYLPQWLFRGAAHWLCKLHPRARDHAYFCSYENVTVSGSGARWEAKARKIAAQGPARDPVERMFQASTARQCDYRMHIRSWSWFDVFIREDRERFVAFVKLLRGATEARVAAKQAFGQAPEYVDDRWRERVLGKRRDVTASKREREREVDVEEAGSRELRDIARETDLQLVAGKIRGLERCANVRTARLLVSLIDSRQSDRVREVIALVLARTTDPQVLAWLRGDGYRRAGRLAKSTLCRTFGRTGHKEAVSLLREAMGGGFWLVRADAMRALAQLGDTDSIPAIAKLAGGAPKGKLKIGAMNALAIFGKAAAGTVPDFERNLLDRNWQVQVATCDTFRALGSDAAVEPLIGRIDREGGRVHDEIRRALKSLTGMDEDWNSEQWRTWWRKMRDLKSLREKMKKELDKEREKQGRAREPGARSGRTVARRTTKRPTYYGIRVYARAVGYVLDTSLSMEQGFCVSETWQRRLGRTYTATTRMGVCKEELAQAISELDPRTRLNLVFFNDRVRLWKPAPVPAGAMGDNAISAVRSLRPNGQTNYYDALRAVLGIEAEADPWRAAFADTPDTLFFLTDGTPTDGEITKADELLAWFNERNRFARLRVHVIAMGNTGVDLEFLRKFATSNGGTFLHLTGSN